MNPRFPIFIPSKSRAKIATTPVALDRIGVPYRIVVEREQYDDYAEHFPELSLIVLNPDFQDSYDTCDDLGATLSRGPGPARNFIWQLSVDEGYPWHWVLDDNIRLFARLHDNQRIPVADGTIFHAMETFVMRYRNVGMAGPHYWMFAPSRDPRPPFVVGSRVYSCNLIRNDLPQRWRGRFNEDTILSLDLLKAGWNTVLFTAFLAWKTPTQVMPGGNTEAFYQERGTLAKSQMLVREHPDVAKLTWKFGRWHHSVNYSCFRKMQLLPSSLEVEESDYRLRLVNREQTTTRHLEQGVVE